MLYAIKSGPETIMIKVFYEPHPFMTVMEHESILFISTLPRLESTAYLTDFLLIILIAFTTVLLLNFAKIRQEME